MKKHALTIWVLITILLVAVFVIPSVVSRSADNFIRKIAAPVSRPLVSFGRKTANFFSLVFEIGNLRRENQRLANDVVQSKVDSVKMAELSTENLNLKTQLSYKEAHPDMKLLLVNVISLDPTNYFGTLTVDRGSNDEVAAGQAVTSLGVLVGKIDQVLPDSSRVLLITSKDSIVQVMLQDSRTFGVLSGGISGMKLGSIPLDTIVNPSESIITSGLGGRLPKGIYVGVAGNEISVKSDIFKTIEVKSPIDFFKLENLFVITGV